MNGYNISYETASIFFMSIVIICLLQMRRKRTDRYKKFLILLISVLCGLIFDVIGAVSISCLDEFGATASLIINTLYFFFAGFTGFAYFRYTEAYVSVENDINRLSRRFAFAVMIIYTALLVMNIFTGWIFYFENGKYMFGLLHIVPSVVTIFFIFFGVLFSLLHHKEMNSRELGSFSGFIVVLVGVILQNFVFPGTLLTFFFGSIAVLILLLFVETPDYEGLQDALKKLDDARFEAEKAGLARGEFLSLISREIKTPMNTILGMDELILRESDDEYITGYARDISTAGNSLMDIINKILDYSELESGKTSIVTSPYRMEKLCREVYGICQPAAEEKGLKLSCNTGSLIPDVLVGDSVRIRQIMINLVSNAVKFTSKGSVSMYVGSSEIDDKNVMLEIRISDTGIGIKEEELAKIFGSFDRSGDVFTNNLQGIGLGLTIVSKITEMMNGKITVESTYGKGSVFTVRIPQKLAEESDLVAETPEPEKSEEIEGPLFKAPDAKILIVDDNEINRSLEAMLLGETQVGITQAVGGNEMLELLARENFDVVLLDHIMPDMDGVEALKRAKQIENVKKAGTTFIAITANAFSGSRDEYLRQGFDEYLSKPINARRLEEVIMKHLDENLLK